MAPNRYDERRSHLLTIYQHALKACDPAICVDRYLRYEGQSLFIQGQELILAQQARVILLAIGKASIRMTQAAARILGPRLSHGLVVTPVASSDDLPETVTVIQGGHPLPTEGSLTAGVLAQKLLSDLEPRDVVLALISGGGSALLEIPRPGISLEDLRQVTLSLLRSGAPIEEINLVRKAMSLSKAGGLARLADPAQVIAFIMSDVVGNRLEAVASGPTVFESIEPPAAIEILRAYRLWDGLPNPVCQAFDRSTSSYSPAREPTNILIGSNHMLVEAAVERAVELGFDPVSVSDNLTGEARKVGETIAEEMLTLVPGVCLIQGGETTVTIRGDGKGGRNQELALAAAMRLAGAGNAALLSAASDGVDGPTDAAGAWVDGSTISRARAAGLNASEYLDQNNSYPFFDNLGSLIRTGPTGTNVNDLVIGLKYNNGG